MFRKEEKLLSLFVHDMIAYPENSRESAEKLIREYERGQYDGQYQNKYTSGIFQSENTK